MKEEDIKEILNSHQICFVPHATICATVKAGIGAYYNGMGEIMHTMKDHILHINAQGIAILAVDDMNGVLQTHTLLFIACEDILSTNIVKKLFHLHFTIVTRKGTIVYKVHKNVLAAPWHKINLSYLLLHHSSYKEKEKS